MMKENRVVISKVWFEDIKDCVEVYDPIFFEECGRVLVEVTVGDNFDSVSKEKGWIE